MKYAVAYISFFDNELNISFVEANSIREAANTAMKYDSIEDLPEDLEDLKREAFSGDSMVDVKELPK